MGLELAAAWRSNAAGYDPDATLTVTPQALSNEATAKFEFRSTLPGRFACRLGGAAPAECTSPHAVRVIEGAHTFEVAAASAASAARARKQTERGREGREGRPKRLGYAKSANTS